MKTIHLLAAPLALFSAQGVYGQAADSTLLPGQWEQTTEFVSFDMPGIPPSVRGMVQSELLRPLTLRHCITPIQSANPRQISLGSYENCRHTNFEFSGGQIRIAAICQGPGGPAGGDHYVNAEGTYTATTLNIEVSSTIEDGPMGAMRMHGITTGRRIAETCTG